MKNSKEEVIIVFPSLSLKNDWIEKLKNRYNESQKDKDYKAWKNAEDRYEENITELMQSGYKFIEIKDMNYDLKELIECF